MKHHVFVISDLHLSQPPMPMMMRHPDALAAFIAGIPSRCDESENIHLMIAGDFVDYLVLAPFESVTRDPEAASRKLRHALAGGNTGVVDALRAVAGAGVRLTVMAGNHDIEWAHPAVQRTFVEMMGDGRAAPEFVVHGEAWRLGGLLVEHGNRYDGANENDWDGMRALVSSQSRGETLHARDRFRFGKFVEPSAGSELVVNVLNPVRDRYPFVPLLQPEGLLTGLLLRVLEPSLEADWSKVVKLLGAHRASGRTAPGAIRHVAASSVAGDAELDEAFPGIYRSLRSPSGVREVSLGDWVRLFAARRADSVAQAIAEGRPLPPESLKRLQLLLRRFHRDDHAFTRDGDCGALGDAAELMVGRDGIQTVVMGHTHQARVVGKGAVPSYINTGTWTDRVLVPAPALAPGEAGLAALEAFLVHLCGDDARSRSFTPHFAEIELAELSVVSARLGLADTV